jgi:Zn-dependent protease with chaperone function
MRVARPGLPPDRPGPTVPLRGFAARTVRTDARALMATLFYNWGRTLGRLGMPALQKAKWAWHAVAGSETDRRRAEQELGRTLALQVRTEAGDPPAPADVARVRTIGTALAACLRDKQFRFHFEAIGLAEPTAFALPGGYIFATTPLLDLCQRYPDEIAFVLGHEMAHVVRGHATDRFLEDTFLKAVASRLGRASPLGGLLQDTALRLLASNYSQDAEFEADEFGSRLAEAAGHHPLAGVRLLDRLRTLDPDPPPLAQYFSSHPPPAQRMSRLGAIWRQRR